MDALGHGCYEQQAPKDAQAPGPVNTYSILHVKTDFMDTMHDVDMESLPWVIGVFPR